MFYKTHLTCKPILDKIRAQNGQKAVFGAFTRFVFIPFFSLQLAFSTILPFYFAANSHFFQAQLLAFSP